MVLVFLCFTAWTTIPAAADDFLKFKLLNNGQPLEARVARYDFDEQTVTLVSRDGSELVVTISELGIPDKRLIVKALQQNLFQKPQRAPAGDATRKNQPASLRPLVWHNNLRQASAKASGGESGEDQRPIVWIRVLGDLRGLM